MMPLALILSAKGQKVSGSDRSYDQGKSPDKFQTLKSLGINLSPQDGSGPDKQTTRLIVSGAIEGTVPDVMTARKLGISIQTRAEVLAKLFNSYKNAISIAGTSGKSTVTGMTASIISYAGLDPTVMNGGLIENFTGAEQSPFPNMRTGQGDVFITETDESDGSIALYNPSIAVLNNIALDHMPLDDLKSIFLKFINRASHVAILNADDQYIQNLKAHITVPYKTYAIENDADLKAENIQPHPEGIIFEINDLQVNLKVPGRHNALNALAALSASIALGIDLNTAIKGLETFSGIKRRMQIIGTKDNITIIDDFGHNPDKIKASLQTLKEFDGRLIVMFQPHGFGPLKLMGKEIVQSFADHLDSADQLIMPEAYYAGGTVDRSVTAKDIIATAGDQDINAHWFENREATKPYILKELRAGDRLVIMGARDDTLTDFAKDILSLI